MAQNKADGNLSNIFSISANDYSGALCECDECQILVKKYKTQVGPLYEYLIEAANIVKDKYPENRLQALAYRRRQGEVPPAGLKFSDNVVIVFCLVDNNLAQAVDSDENLVTLRNLEAWSKACENLWVWYYPEPYSPWANLPYDSMHHFAKDMRILRDKGVTEVFIENDAAHTQFYDLCDLKQWLILKLVWNPDANLDELVKNIRIHSMAQQVNLLASIFTHFMKMPSSIRRIFTFRRSGRAMNI